MGVSVIGAASGGAVERVTATVTPTGGVFTLDLDSADDFTLNGFDSQFVDGTARRLPTFVGSQTVTRIGSTATSRITVNFNLTGGVASTPGPGDIVIIHASIAAGATYVDPTNDFIRDPSNVNYTDIIGGAFGANDTNAVGSRLSYKVMGATPDTAFTYQQNNGNSSNSTAITVAVFRNFDPVIFDTTTATNAKTNGLNITPNSSTTVNDNSLAMVFVAGGTSGETYSGVTQDLVYQNLITADASDTYDAIHLFATIQPELYATAGTAVTTPAIIPSVVSTQDSSLAFTVFLRGLTTTNPVPLPATIEYIGTPRSGFTYNVAILNDLEIVLDSGGYWEESLFPNIYLNWDVAFSSGPALAINDQYALTSFTAIAGVLAERSFSAPKTLKTRQVTSSQLWTAPVDVTEIELILCGGGGGGSAGGGGGSVFYNPYIAVDPGAAYLVTIGAGGVGGATPTNGSTSSFSNLFTATGGLAPSSGNIAAGGKQAGLGGSGGNAGGDATAVNGNSMAGAPGAFNFGGGGGGGTTTSSRVGQASNGGGQGERTIGNHGLANTGGGGGGINGTVTSYGNGGSGVAIIKYWSSL